MREKAIILFLLVGCIFITIALAPTFGADFEGNKCYTDWTWCNDGTVDENAYWWQAGWCVAAIEEGIITGSVSNCTSSPDGNYVASVVEEKKDKDKSKNKTEDTEEIEEVEEVDD